MDSILDSVSSLVGVGKSAAIEKENAKLKAENERIRKAFPDAVKTEVEKQAKALVVEKLKAEAERDRALVQNRSLTIERDKAVRQASGTASQRAAAYPPGGKPSHGGKRQDHPPFRKRIGNKPQTSECLC